MLACKPQISSDGTGQRRLSTIDTTVRGRSCPLCHGSLSKDTHINWKIAGLDTIQREPDSRRLCSCSLLYSMSQIGNERQLMSLCKTQNYSSKGLLHLYYLVSVSCIHVRMFCRFRSALEVSWNLGRWKTKRREVFRCLQRGCRRIPLWGQS